MNEIASVALLPRNDGILEFLSTGNSSTLRLVWLIALEVPQ
ncbi:hypothetical protein [Campylobacter sp.]|nr:hypothetical protein [Campylobacter sp.]